MTKKPTTTLHVPLSAATLEDIARDFERRAAEAAPRNERSTQARIDACARSETWEEAARILRGVAARKVKP